MSHKITEEDSMMAKKVKEKYAGPRVTDTETFVKKARWVHGDKYDYSRVEYKNLQTKLSIVCPCHGVFDQLPRAHVHNGAGCPSCAGRKPWNLNRFLGDAVNVHGYKYDYSLIKSVTGSRDRVSIICDEHGIFEQLAGPHIYNAAGCPMCHGRNLSNKKRIKKFIEVHGYKYDYSKVVYVTAKDKVTVICKKHGEFLVSPNNHVSGRGCPTCKLESISEKAKGSPNFSKMYYKSDKNKSNLYILIIGQQFCKVGLAKDIPTRMRVISNSVKDSVEKVYYISGKANDLWTLEQKILRHSNLKRFHPEVSFAGSTECLHLSEIPKVLAIIEEWEKNQQPEEEIEEDA